MALSRSLFHAFLFVVKWDSTLGMRMKFFSLEHLRKMFCLRPLAIVKAVLTFHFPYFNYSNFSWNQFPTMIQSCRKGEYDQINIICHNLFIRANGPKENRAYWTLPNQSIRRSRNQLEAFSLFT